jgi:general stress protein YciG
VKGFQRMSAARRREVARAGGRAAQAQGVAHRWTHEEARVAGKKGGEAKRANAESVLRRK